MIAGGLCCICCKPCGTLLCGEHRKRFIYKKRYDFVCLKPRRKVSKGQKEIYNHIRQILKRPIYMEVVFPWAHAKSYSFYRYDIVVHDKKIIVEYDGELHFKYVEFFHKSKENFRKSKKIDKIKEKLAKQNGWKVIRFSYMEELSIENIKRKLRI